MARRLRVALPVPCARSGGDQVFLRVKAGDLSLSHTLDSGQLFRWWPLDRGYFVCVRDRAFSLRLNDGHLEADRVTSADARFLHRFLSLDTSLTSVYAGLERAGFPRDIMERWRGLRIVRQDLWECLVSFACSSANNIKRIRGMIGVMCLHWGDFARCAGEAYRTFPRPGALGSERDLRKMGFGFRAAYLARINKIATPAWLQEVSALNYEDARSRLMELPGVSDKIADCVALFALGHMQAFPVDTWIRRAVIADFLHGEERSDNYIRQWAQDQFGADAGYAQQYLFHEWRHRRSMKMQPSADARPVPQLPNSRTALLDFNLAVD